MGSILRVGEPGQWDDYSAFQPEEFRQDGYYDMIYTGSNAKNNTGYRWGDAWSPHGIQWKKSPNNPFFGPGPESARGGGKAIAHQLPRTGPDTYKMYYCGAPRPSVTYIGIGLVQGRLEKVDD